MSIPQHLVPLFGGALSASLPTAFTDASQFREVPDNQEVFVSAVDDTDISVIFDILQRVEVDDGSDEAAVWLHWKDITVDEKEGRREKVWGVEEVRMGGLPDRKAYSLLGTISARPRDRRNESDPHTFTALLVTVVRLEDVATDIVITVNVPHNTAEAVWGEGTVASPVDGRALDGLRGSVLNSGILIKENIVESFKVEDWGLFVNEP